ncbi:hypothetical protein ACHAXR_008933 [Thalassiosira sp. AJA248-18]
MSNSVASSRVGRNKKYNIAPEFLSSPYLSKPIGSFNEKRKKGGSPSEVSRNAKSTARRRRGDSDAGSVASFRTNRSVSSYRTQQTYQRPSQNGARRMTSMKNFLLPREMEKLLRGFRQKSQQTRFEQQKNEDDYEDDTSTIASDSAESLDDKAVYLQIRSDSKGKDGEDVFGSIFSSPIFAEIALRNCDREVSDGPILTLPPVGILDHDKSGGDVSDLESLHSSSSKLMVDHKLPVYSRRKR